MAPELFDAILDELAVRLAARLASRQGPPTPRFADAENNPLGSARAFQDAARRGDFPSFIRNRRVTALWSDVEQAMMQKRPRRRPAPTAPEIDDDRAELAAAGVPLRLVSNSTKASPRARDAGRGRR
jgi:hypothetical protein